MFFFLTRLRFARQTRYMCSISSSFRLNCGRSPLFNRLYFAAEGRFLCFPAEGRDKHFAAEGRYN